MGRHERELAFYSSALSAVEGPVLEIACGTGMILLPLLERGMDAYGFDLSPQMLRVLFQKAEQKKIGGIHSRVTIQNMADFRYEIAFGAVIVPARSFLHLTTQADQIRCLKTIRSHLRIGGQVLLNFFTPNLAAILKNAVSEPVRQDFGTFRYRDTDQEVRVSYVQRNSIAEQVQRITWQFEMAGQLSESSMEVSWIYRKEFELLAQVAGLHVVALYSGFERAPYDGQGEMVWVLERSSE